MTFTLTFIALVRIDIASTSLSDAVLCFNLTVGFPAEAYSGFCPGGGGGLKMCPMGKNQFWVSHPPPGLLKLILNRDCFQKILTFYALKNKKYKFTYITAAKIFPNN